MISEHHPFRYAVLAILLLAVAVAGAAYAYGGRSGCEKALTALVLPCGALWLMLAGLAAALWSTRQPGTAAAATLAWVLLSLTGNDWVAGRLAAAAESEFVAVDPLEAVRDEPCDVVVLLGGGVWERPAPEGSRPQLGFNGDRVAVTARIYNAGLAPRVHCTGSVSDRLSRLTLSEAEIGRDLLIGLGVPAKAITLGDGANTKEELSAIADDLGGGETKPRIGIVSSAWHLPRVKRLVAEMDVDAEIVLLPADFRSPPQQPPPGAVAVGMVPSAASLLVCQTVCREWLAALASR